MSSNDTRPISATREPVGPAMGPPPEQQPNVSPTKRPVTDPHRTKHLSLNLPVQPIWDGGQLRHPPVTVTSTTSVSPTLALPMEQPIPSPTHSGFLVALAAQERRVLELKEELHRAESDLAELKRQWAMREARRKRDDIRQMQKLQPLRTTFKEAEGNDDDVDGRAQLRKEHERRKAMSVGSRSSDRKVIAGQRHTRALSLLSPERLNSSHPTASPNLAACTDDNKQRPNAPPAFAPTSTPAPPSLTVEAQVRTGRPLHSPPKEAFLRTGRQLAEDFKDGLWTFIDDLRQATIGDEPIHGRHPRRGQRQPSLTLAGRDGSQVSKQSSLNQLKTAKTQRNSLDSKAVAEKAVVIEIGERFWREHGVLEHHEQKESRNTTETNRPVSDVQLDEPQEDTAAWEDWDSLHSSRDAVQPSG